MSKTIDNTVQAPEPIETWDAWAFPELAAGFIMRLLQQAPEHPERDWFLDTIRLLITRLEEGHICLPINPQDNPLTRYPPSAHVVAEDSQDEHKPLCIYNNRLYTRRMFVHEQAIRSLIAQRLSRSVNIHSEQLSRARELADRLFTTWNRQKLAALMALQRYFFIISGGPGTGKTTTVVRILALYRRMFPEMRMAIAAPTGKAAHRLQSAMRTTIQTQEELRELELPTEVSTLHRLLRRHGLGGGFYHNRDHPLPVDLLVIDEASMVGLELMSQTLEALTPDARILLLGDHNQLASVEAGAVLGELCAAGEQISAAVLNTLTDKIPLSGAPLQPVSPSRSGPLMDAMVEFQDNYRFASESGIGRLARLVVAGAAKDAIEYLQSATTSDTQNSVRWSLLNHEDITRLLRTEILEYMGPICRSHHEPEEALRKLDGFRILCATRSGILGVHNINRLARYTLEQAGVLSSHYRMAPGTPIMVLRNDYHLGVFNGDTGIVIQKDRDLFCYFESPHPAESGRLIPLRMLPPHEMCFAMTIHKSQGSEFDRTVLVLPDEDNPLLSRELIYTAVTRARKTLHVIGGAEILRGAIERRIQRVSGLRDWVIASRSEK